MGSNRYSVKGILTDMWGKGLGSFSTETAAVSATKAKSNALYQAKKRMNLDPGCPVKWYSVTVTQI